VAGDHDVAVLHWLRALLLLAFAFIAMTPAHAHADEPAPSASADDLAVEVADAEGVEDTDDTEDDTALLDPHLPAVGDPATLASSGAQVGDDRVQPPPLRPPSL
jgi:hypothetical protein